MRHTEPTSPFVVEKDIVMLRDTHPIETSQLLRAFEIGGQRYGSRLTSATAPQAKHQPKEAYHPYNKQLMARENPVHVSHKVGRLAFK